MNKEIVGNSKFLVHQWNIKKLEANKVNLVKIRSTIRLPWQLSNMCNSKSFPKINEPSAKPIEEKQGKNRCLDLDRKNQVIIRKIRKIMNKMTSKTKKSGEENPQNYIQILQSSRGRKNIVEVSPSRQHRHSVNKWDKEKAEFSHKLSKSSDNLLPNIQKLRIKNMSRSSRLNVLSRTEVPDKYIVDDNIDKNIEIEEEIFRIQRTARSRAKLLERSIPGLYETPSQTGFNGENTYMPRTILHKQLKRMNFRYYHVEISLEINDEGKQNMVIRAFNLRDPETLLIKIPRSKSLALCDVFNNNYALIVKQLRLVGNKLLILTPTQEDKQEVTQNNSALQGAIHITGEQTQRIPKYIKRYKSTPKSKIYHKFNHAPFGKSIINKYLCHLLYEENNIH